MRSDIPKVLHPVAGHPMIQHVLHLVDFVPPRLRVVVVGPDMDDVADAVSPARIATQQEPLGTGDAVAAARPLLNDFNGDILVLFGDTPLVRAETVQALRRERRNSGASIVLLGFRPSEPGPYGRLATNADGDVVAIVESRDASPAEQGIELCNSGVMIVDGMKLFSLLERVGRENAKGEYYLTDIVRIGREAGCRCRVVETRDPREAMGVNSRVELAAAEAVMQERLRLRAMEGGATLVDPDSVWLSADTVIGRDVTVEPDVIFGPGVRIGDRALIRSFSHIEGAELEADTVVGPFARLRPGTRLMAQARIGNFVEIKAARIESGARINHLTYIGDASIGARTNIGAGTITCNYDGATKHPTHVGSDAFIGSNTALVAPVTVGDCAVVGAGSVITADVGRDCLAIARSRQRNFDGRAAAVRRMRKPGGENVGP